MANENSPQSPSGSNTTGNRTAQGVPPAGTDPSLTALKAATAAMSAAGAAQHSAAAAAAAQTAAQVALGGTAPTQPAHWEQIAPRKRELVCGFVALGAWITIFVVGYVVPTQMLRDAIGASTQSWAQASFLEPSDQAAQPTTPPAPAVAGPRADLRGWAMVGSVLLVGLAFTLSNIVFLCLCAS